MSEPFIPYGRHVIEDDDVAAVVEVLRGDWLTTGPMVGQFEEAFARYVGADHAVAVSNGTAALHLAMLAAGIGPGDEVIVPALTFAASANCVRYAGGTVVFADVRDDTLTVDPAHVASLVTPRTKAIVAVDYAGLPCDLDELLALCTHHGLLLVEDACHALGAEYRGRKVGSIAHLSTFSFHPVKHLTTGEGGMVTTNDPALAARVCSAQPRHRERPSSARARGDVALRHGGARVQLPPAGCAVRARPLAAEETSGMARTAPRGREAVRVAVGRGAVSPSAGRARRSTPRVSPLRDPRAERAVIGWAPALYSALWAAGIAPNVHYIPVYFHSYYQQLGYKAGLCPRAETAYEGLLSLPMWHGMTDAQQDRVVTTIAEEIRRRV